MSRLKMFIVLGLPGAGKSTFIKSVFNGQAEEPCTDLVRADSQRICFDSLRAAFGHVYSQATEVMVHAVACAMARAAFHEGRDVVVDEAITDTYLAGQLAEAAREYGATIHMAVINRPVEECLAARVPYGFPEKDFTRKAREWRHNQAGILTLADYVHCITSTESNPLEPSGEHRRTECNFSLQAPQEAAKREGGSE